MKMIFFIYLNTIKQKTIYEEGMFKFKYVVIEIAKHVHTTWIRTRKVKMIITLRIS